MRVDHIVLRGLAGGGERLQDEERETMVMFMMGSMVAGVLLMALIVAIYKGVKRYVFKIKDPPKSFVVDKKVKCKNGKTGFFCIEFLSFLYIVR